MHVRIVFYPCKSITMTSENYNDYFIINTCFSFHRMKGQTFQNSSTFSCLMILFIIPDELACSLPIDIKGPTKFDVTLVDKVCSEDETKKKQYIHLA